MLIDQVNTTEYAQQWLIFFDAQTGRIAHVTEDTSIATQLEGVNLIGDIVSSKPVELSSTNSAAWIYDTNGFTHIGFSHRASNSISLLEFNRQAVIKLLNNKIDAIRKARLDAIPLSQSLRGEWDSESKIAGSGSIAYFQEESLLINRAAAQNQTVAQTRASALRADAQRDTLLISTELRREELLKEIFEAESKQLIMFRERIVSEFSLAAMPEVQVVEVHSLNASLHGDALASEKFRLHAVLKQKINQIRKPYISAYHGDDIAQKMLLMAANNFLVVKHQAHADDFKMLISYAAFRSMSIIQAAEKIIKAHKELESMLFDTEQLKDSVSAKIDSASTPEQLNTLANEIIKYRFFVNDHHPNESSKPTKKGKANELIDPGKIREQVQKFMPASGEVRDIKKFAKVTQNEFSCLSQAGQPFIITELIKEWPVHALGLDWLKSNCGQIPVKARINDYVANAFSKNREHLDLSLYAYLELIEQGAFDAAGLPPYLGNQEMPEVSVLCNWPGYFDDWAPTKTWIGPKGTVTPLHCDYNDNLFAQIAGSKKFILYPPHVAEKLNLKQVNPVLFASEFDPTRPNFLEHPEMQSIQPLECVVNEGELLYLPAGWFHHVGATSFSFSMNRWSRDLPAVLKKNSKHPQLKSKLAKEQEAAWNS
jgi:hypothetical protein